MTGRARRGISYLVFLMAALVLGVTPCVIAPDMVVPTTPVVKSDHLETRLFHLLALPPSSVRSMLGFSGGYVRFFQPDGFSDGLPTFGGMAREHLVFAIPLWFVLQTGTYEALGLVVRGFRRKPTSRHGNSANDERDQGGATEHSV